MKLLILLIETLEVAGYLENRDWLQVIIDPTDVIPEDFDILEGTPVKSYCGSLSPVVWTYSRNENVGEGDIDISSRDDPLPSGFRLGNNTVILTNLSELDSGSFNCIGTYHDHEKRTKRFRNWFSVKVWSEIQVGLVLPSIIEVSESENVTLTCGSTKQVEWFGLTLPDQQKSVTNNTLTLWNLSKEFSGPYICRGTLISRKIFHSRSIVLVDLQVILDRRILIYNRPEHWRHFF